MSPSLRAARRDTLLHLEVAHGHEAVPGGAYEKLHTRLRLLSSDKREGSSLDAQRALADGAAFVKNAEEEMDRKILREDQLYFIDNQVEALDTFLADTEELNGNAPVEAMRQQLRDLKGKLEKKVLEWLATQEGGGELPEDLPPAETAADMVEAGAEIIKMADDALKTKVKSIEEVTTWEDPLAAVNSFLADSEVYVQHNQKLVKVRADVRSRKMELQKRIADLVQDWRQRDLAGGAGDEDEE